MGWIAGLGLALALVFGAGYARADGLDAELERLVADINDATGAEGYVFVREIWGKWGDSDPRAVEAVLQSLAVAPALDRGVREYAAFFAAHARTRQGDIGGAKRAIDGLGYVTEWLVVGPFDNEGKAGFDAAYGPEAQLREVIVPGRAYTGKERAVRWRRVPQEAAALGWLNGSSLFRPEQNSCFYARSYFEAERDVGATAWVGVRGAYRFYIDGEAVDEDPMYRGHDVDRSAVSVRLGAGYHSLTVKACGTTAAPIVSVRLVPDAGKPFDFKASFVASELSQEQGGSVRVMRHGLGPLARFKAASTAKRAPASAYYNFARYLVLSEGDDPAVHEARDLARRAVELEPSAKHLVLAGALAEDDNEERASLERAQALATGPQDTLQVLLATAELERRSVNWRRAAPLYARAVALAPDSSEALTGHAEALSRVGLPRTALRAVQSALERHPYSVNLLNLYSSQLETLGMLRAAREAEDRYALFRADDAEYLLGRLAMSLARDERALAEHWAARLLEYKADSLWVLSQVADAYLALGQADRARAELNRGLELAPHDVGLLRALADLHGRLGERDEQLVLLRRILELRPQSSDVEQYVQFIEPQAPRLDESFAIAPDEFLKRRTSPSKGESQRSLVDLTVKTVFDNGLSHEFRQVVFQPLSDAAAAMGRHYVFHFEGASQRVQLRGARVYRTDGKVDRAIETGVGAADDPSVAMYTSARTYNVQFPRLEAGDVVELLYRIEDVSGRNELNDYFGDVHYFQSSQSTAHAEYVLVTPKARVFYVDTTSLKGLKRTERVDGDRRIARFVIEDTEPIAREPSMPAWPEVAPFLHVSTYRNYQELGKWYWGLVQDQFELDAKTRQLAHELADGLPSVPDKVAAIYGWVIKNTRYVALEFGIYGIKPRRCVQTVARGWGDCKDKATVIVALLRELGIDASLVLVRTQLRGRFRSEVASLAPFDHAIAYVPALDLYLDGTAEATGTGELPAMDQGATALQLRQGDARLVELPGLRPENNRDRRTVFVKLDPSGGAALRFEFEVSGVRAPEWRRRFGALSSQRDRLATELRSSFPGLSLSAAGFRLDLADFEAPVRGAASGQAARVLRDEGSDASMAVTWPGSLVGAFASTAKRTFPVAISSFGSVDYTYAVELAPGMRLLSAPSDAAGESEFGSFELKVTQEGRRVTVRSQVSIKVQRVAPKDYAAFRAFCLSVDAAFANRLVVAR